MKPIIERIKAAVGELEQAWAELEQQRKATEPVEPVELPEKESD